MQFFSLQKGDASLSTVGELLPCMEVHNQMSQWKLYNLQFQIWGRTNKTIRTPIIKVVNKNYKIGSMFIDNVRTIYT